MTDSAERILRDLRGSVTDAEVEISDAVRELEAGNHLEVEALLAEALTKLRILGAEIDRHLSGRGSRRPCTERLDDR